MNIRQMKDKEIALIVHGLNAIYVAEDEKLRQKMLKEFNDELAVRGLRLAEFA